LVVHDVVNTVQLAALGSVSPVTAWRWARLIPGARKVGRDWLVPRSGVSEFLKSRVKAGPKGAGR
jgi:hypothetical protein